MDKLRIIKECAQRTFKTWCICSSSFFSLVQILFSFVFWYGNVDNEFETKENKNKKK